MSSSLLTNASALTALQALTMTQQELGQTQNQISTGLKVQSAADNAAYWSIAQHMSSDNGVLGAVTNSLGESTSILAVANAALTSVLSTINNIKNDLVSASNPGADLVSINADLQQQGHALTSAVAGASFNGLNMLDGSSAGVMNFVSGFQQTATGGILDTINLSTQALYTGSTPKTSTVTQPSITDAASMATILGLVDNTGTVTAAAYGQTQVNTASNPDQVAVTAVDINGVTTTTTYSGLDVNGNATTVGAAVSFGVQVATTYGAGAGLLTQGTSDLTNLNITTANVAQTLTNVDSAFAAVTSYASQVGSTQSRINQQTNFISNLANALTTGVASLIDADMNQASTRLNALQTQQQLGIQSLSIANQNTQLILKLFGI